jgi:diguanylate cyclase (GGDEF)-like protein
MARTIFILGTDPQQCKELGDILRTRITDEIIMPIGSETPDLSKSDAVVIDADDKPTGMLYRGLMRRLEEQVHRAELLSELIRLFSSSLQIDELLDGVVSKSTQVLGDTSLIALAADSGQLKLEAAFSADRDRLVKMLITTVNQTDRTLKSDLLSSVVSQRQSVVIPNVLKTELTADLRAIAERHEITSLIAVPIQTKDIVLGAFVSLSTGSKVFTSEDLATASAIADFTAIALENAGLFAELQRAAITDSLTGVYNTRFFHEILGRETARAERYGTSVSLLMLDIDMFKGVNDTFGHVVGNKVLTEVARILEQTVRNTDFVFRCGGDEFGIVLAGTGLDGARHVAEKIRRRIEAGDILTKLGYSGQVTVSIGASEYHRGSNFETLVADADQALYKSKRSSKKAGERVQSLGPAGL